MWTSARTRADSASVRPCDEMALRATSFQRPAENEPVKFSQYWAMRTCSFVRLSEIARTSLTVFRNAGESKPGGGGARKSAPVARKKGRASPSRGWSGGRGGCNLLDHFSVPAGPGPDHARSDRSAL